MSRALYSLIFTIYRKMPNTLMILRSINNNLFYVMPMPKAPPSPETTLNTKLRLYTYDL